MQNKKPKKPTDLEDDEEQEQDEGENVKIQIGDLGIEARGLKKSKGILKSILQDKTFRGYLYDFQIKKLNMKPSYID